MSEQKSKTKKITKDTSDTSNDIGVLMIQIDGLSYYQFLSAVKHKKLSFVSKLLEDDKFSVSAMYSGLPSTTPAVQAELFYGVKSAVPAFSFKDRTKNIFGKMFDPSFSHTIQESFNRRHKNLLSKGSSYSNIYTGGANYSHFCPAGFLNPSNNSFYKWLRSIIIILIYPLSILRIIFLFFIEVCVALYDFATGFYRRKAFFKEIIFIPLRVVICVVIKELITILAIRDIKKGLKIVHLNFIGYDEQAHLRGPDSKFAHWSLHGIDNSIKRIYKAINYSNKRNYKLVIYSDHGQEKVKSYFELYGERLELAISKYMDSKLQSERKYWDGVRNKRIHWLRKMGGYKRNKSYDVADSLNNIRVEAIGPVGHVYGLQNYNKENLKEVAKNFVNKLNIPLVCIPDKPDDVFVISKNWSGYITKVSEKVFGLNHPFYDFLTEDLIKLCTLDNSGEIVLFSWYSGVKPISFTLEKGAHAGFAPNECSAFLLTSNEWLKEIKNNAKNNKIRPEDLRNHIFKNLE